MLSVIIKLPLHSSSHSLSLNKQPFSSPAHSLITMLSEPRPQAARHSRSPVLPLYPFTKTQQWLAEQPSATVQDLLFCVLCDRIFTPSLLFCLRVVIPYPHENVLTSAQSVVFLAIQTALQEFRDADSRWTKPFIVSEGDKFGICRFSGMRYDLEKKTHWNLNVVKRD